MPHLPVLTRGVLGATNVPMDPRRMQVEVVRRAPLISIDLVIEDGAGRVLVGMRVNEPAKGCWFVPGGRVIKDERLDDAFARVLLREVGWRRHRREAEFLGAFEHFYDTNFAGEPDVTTHYVVLSYRLEVPNPPPVTPDDQHEHLEWMPIPELLSHPAVHENTKVYFRRGS